MISDSKLEDFKRFSMKEPENLTKAKSLQGRAQTLLTKINLVDDTKGYQSAGVGGLVSQTSVLVSELVSTIAACSSLSDYLTIAATPTDMTQVAQGASLKAKLDGVDPSEIAPSLLPVVSKSELEGLEQELEAVEFKGDEIAVLLGEINGYLVVDEEFPLIEPSVPSSVQQEASTLENELSLIVGNLYAAALVVTTMVSEAETNRTEALELFDLAVSFAVCDSQSGSVLTSDAIQEITELI